MIIDHRAMRRPSQKRSLSFLPWLILLVVLAAAQLWYEQEKHRHPAASTAPSQPSKSFAIIQSGRLQQGANNDGDSFVITHAGGAHEFRLFFADCPEKRRHRYNGERLKDQGRYFGGLSEDETVRIGQQAAATTQRLMESQPFTIHTKWQRVYDSQRFYAFVIFDDGQDLSEKLVRAGLARIHTTGAPHPDGRRASTFERHLRQLESEARQARRGAWGVRP